MSNSFDVMANDTTTSQDTKTTTQDQTSDNNLPAAPGGNSDNRETIQNLDAPALRTAVVELLTIIDDSDDLNVVVTVADDGTVLVEAA
ncbi:MAG: hypothetical protein QOG14_2421 [Mycobacterium sp.]|nr:hypothetical protein [Mycobacterium sp.]